MLNTILKGNHYFPNKKSDNSKSIPVMQVSKQVQKQFRHQLNQV